MASNLAVAGTYPSFFKIMGKISSLPILTFLNFKQAVPSVSASVGF
jgi:hypothetical protein